MLESKKNGTLGLDKYSYVSLFGVNSLQTLKLNIFENIVTKEFIGTDPGIESFKKNTKNIINTLSRGGVQQDNTRVVGRL